MAAQTFCANLSSLNSADDAGIDLFIKIPDDAQGVKGDTVVFTSTAS